MEEKKKHVFNSPILNYYSHIINPSNPEYNSEISKLKQFHYSHSYQSPSPKYNFKSNQTSPNSEINIRNENENKPNDNMPNANNNLNINLKEIILVQPKKENNSQNYNKKIKSITTDDLIQVTVNGNTIIRINPLVYENESYEFLSSNIYILLRDQLGSKYLQEKLENDTQNAVFFLYPALMQNLLYLIKDSFANYFIQKICYFLSEEQIENIIKIITPQFLDICRDIYGSRVIQGIMNNLNTSNLRILFFDLIKDIFISLINDMYGYHIIYKFVVEFPDFLDQSNSIIVDNFLKIATHKKGCIFLENYLNLLISIKSNNKQKIIDIILNNCLILITDKIGNYLIQHLISIGEEKINSEIINKILNNISFYSKHRYSSYAIEKLFIFANQSDKNRILKKLTKPEIMSDLLFDQQGSFIILKALQIADEVNRNNMLNIIYNLEPKAKEFPNGIIFFNKLFNSDFYKKDNNYKSFNIKKEYENSK
jgi:hypothetical protein